MAKILMMSERRVIGTTPIFVMRISYMAQIQPHNSRIGVHLFLRVEPPFAFRRFEPKRP